MDQPARSFHPRPPCSPAPPALSLQLRMSPLSHLTVPGPSRFFPRRAGPGPGHSTTRPTTAPCGDRASWAPPHHRPPRPPLRSSPWRRRALDFGTDAATESYLGLNKQLTDPADRVKLGFDWQRPSPCATGDAHNAVTFLLSLLNREVRFPAVRRSPPSAGSLLSCVARRVADPDSPVPLITLLGVYMMYRAAPRLAAARGQASTCRAASRLEATCVRPFR